jgi:hypothetical protein
MAKTAMEQGGQQASTYGELEEHINIANVGGKKIFPVDSTGNLMDGYQAVKITTVGSVSYIGLALPGSLQSAAVWQVFKYDAGVVTYADGNPNFDNIATDLTSLSFS